MTSAPTDGISSPLPTIRRPEVADIKHALRRGWQDFRAEPVFGLAIGGVYTFGGLFILYVANVLGYAFLAFPIMAGFALIGPFCVIALYEVSRLRERGETVTWQAMAKGLTSDVMRECSYLGVLLIFLMAIWLKSAVVVYAMFFGLRLLSLSAISEALFTTGAGLGFLVVGHVIGAGFAILVFSLSVVSFPMMVDRGSDFITALITSIQTVKANPALMLGWGVFIGLALLAGFLSAFIGLMVVLPLLGHASWHLYRRIVV